ncbi:MAG: AsnC family transcriptional regulator [archaeon]|nr:AsnC family transcriptional regulator [archaeon]MCP8306945.1 AsnC family transcriptional regulator [archaeon]
MPLILDSLDIAILRALMEDGRLSYRQVAKRVGVSTPTVEARIRRMKDAGFIKGFAPIFDLTKVEQGVMAILHLRVEAKDLSEVQESLALKEEVIDVFTTAGESNLVAKLMVEGLEDLQRFIEEEVTTLPGVSLTTTQIVTKVVKEGPSLLLKPELKIRMACDYCGGEIAGRPHTLRVGEGTRFFCCNTCLEAYKERYAARLKRFPEES